MTTAAQTLAEFAAGLTFDKIPEAVVERAKACAIDTTAVAAFGSNFPWSRMVAEYAVRYGSGGPCSIIGTDAHVQAPYAALANGVAAAAFEMDSTRHPGVGAHVGATLLPAVLAASEEVGADGKTALTAYVAGCEVLVRVAMAAHGSKVPPESQGFHLPGLVGPYAAAVAAAKVFELKAEQIANALGIAGSLSSGLLAFTKSKQGGTVKRLHIGRGAESGILATRLAMSGYTGPETILEGHFGFLEAYCREPKTHLLTAGLGETWETLRISMRPYACHICNQTPIQSLRALMSEHRFSGADVAEIMVEGVPKLVSHHNIVEPGDVTQGQYSVPFCMAIAMYRDPDDPRSFDTSALSDNQIRAATREKIKVRARTYDIHASKKTRIEVHLKDGRRFEREADSYRGLPENPMNREQTRKKFMILTADVNKQKASKLFDRLERLESEPHFSYE